MLQPFIIEQIRRREEEARRKKSDAERPRLEIVDSHEPAPEPVEDDDLGDPAVERGVVIVDL